jgi:hypothetical protein
MVGWAKVIPRNGYERKCMAPAAPYRPKVDQTAHRGTKCNGMHHISCLISATGGVTREGSHLWVHPFRAPGTSNLCTSQRSAHDESSDRATQQSVLTQEPRTRVLGMACRRCPYSARPIFSASARAHISWTHAWAGSRTCPMNSRLTVGDTWPAHTCCDVRQRCAN